jgi:hypothetical protein
MRETTTIRVAPATRSALRALAESDGVTLDEELSRLARAERQRRFGSALASIEPDDEERRWLDLGTAAIIEVERNDASR